MNIRSTINNTIVAFAAQGISMTLSALQSFVIPKLLGVEQYGYWQLFIFYIGYVGFFHLGLNDGVYLINGGQDRKEIDRSSVKSQLIVSLVYETLFAVAIALLATTIEIGEERYFVVLWTSVYLVVQNSASYLAFVLQAMNETRLSSYSTIVARLSFLVPLGILLALRVESFHPFVVAYTLSVVLQLLYCAWKCRDILLADFSGWDEAFSASAESIRVGSKLMLANLASQLILGVLRVAIDYRWGVATFGKLSLSLSLVSFFLAFVTQAAMVLFPALRQSSEDEIRRFYLVARDALRLFFPSVYLFYFPFVLVVSLWLPAFSDSLRYFAFLMPVCVFDSKMNITCTTLFKVRRKEGLLFKINVATMASCAAMVAIGVFFIESVEVSVVFATMAIIGRSIVSERVVEADLTAEADRMSLLEIGLTIVFVLLAICVPPTAAFFAYVLVYCLFLFAQKRRVLMLLRSIGGSRLRR